MTNILNTRGTSQSLLTTELNSLANNASAVHATSVTLTSAGFISGELELVVEFGTAPTANTGVIVWLLREIDGTNFEDGSASVTPLRTPDGFFPLRAVTTAQRIILDILIPPGPIRALVKNDGTGQSFISSANTLKLRPYTPSI